MASSSRALAKAKMAEQCERFEDMAKCMKEVVNINKTLNVLERNLLSVAYKNVIGVQRSAWRTTSSRIEVVKEKEKDNPLKLKLYKEYQQSIVSKISEICSEVLDLLESLIKEEQNAEAQVFYCKMEGDYHRYLCEVIADKEDSFAEVSAKAAAAYEKAAEVAQTSMDTTSPIRLGLALNFSVFYYEILNKPDKACELAKKAFDDAIADMDNLKEDTYKDSTLIMQLLRDNLTLWTAEGEADEGDQS